jgi:hypothetical protein
MVIEYQDGARRKDDNIGGTGIPSEGPHQLGSSNMIFDLIDPIQIRLWKHAELAEESTAIFAHVKKMIRYSEDSAIGRHVGGVQVGNIPEMAMRFCTICARENERPVVWKTFMYHQ